MSRFDASRLAVWIFRKLVTVYPEWFRSEHGKSLQETFEDRLDHSPGFIRTWTAALAEYADTIRNAARLWRRGPATRPSLSGLESSGIASRWTVALDSMRKDIGFALRMFVRQPGFLGAVVLILALGIGANTAVFSIVRAYLLSPLPFPESKRLMSVSYLPPDAPTSAWQSIPREAFGVDWPQSDEVIEHLVAWDLDGFTLTGAEGTRAVDGAWVTPGYFGAVGAVPEVGRLFTPQDARPGAAPVAVISHDLWHERFGADPSVIGRTLTAYSTDRPDDGEAFTVVGVLPQDFWFVNRFTQMLAALRAPRAPSMVKLNHGVGREQAVQHLTNVVTSQVDGMPSDWSMHLEPAHSRYVATVRPILLVAVVAVGLILLLACANVAIMLLVRAVARERELTVRRALGASRFRLAAQLLTEGVLLSTVAGALALVIAHLSMGMLGPMIEGQLRTGVPGGVSRLTLDPAVLAMAALLALSTGLVFAAIPALTAGGGDLTSPLKEGSRAGADSKRRRLMRDSLITSEIAVSLILLIGATLMVRSTLHLSRLDLGFAPNDVITANVTLRQASYVEPEELTRFVDGLLHDVRGKPGVLAAGVQAGWPFQARRTESVQSPSSAVTDASAGVYSVTPGFFEALMIHRIRGRLFNLRDRAGSEPVAVISRTLAEQLWPGQSPVGRQLVRGDSPGGTQLTVVGVVEDIRESLIEPPHPDLYVPYQQDPRFFIFLMVKVDPGRVGVIELVRSSIAQLDATAALAEVRHLDELVAQQGSRPRFLAGLLTGFGVFGVALALFGLYSLVSFTVEQRRHEVAVRVALGATTRQVLGIFMRGGARVVAVGTGIGLMGSLALSGILQSQLHGVGATDANTFAGISLLLAAVAALAVWLSARKATQADPVAVLRRE